jgi:DNA-binding response OmpR family regulator
MIKTSSASPGKGNLLIVANDPLTRQTLEDILTEEGYRVRCAGDEQTAVRLAEEASPELILMDVRLPDADGYDTCRRLKEDPGTFGTAVILLGDDDNGLNQQKVYKVGASDFIFKPLGSESVLAKIETNLSRLREFQHLAMESKPRKPAATRTKQKDPGASAKSLEEQRRFERLLIDISRDLSV